MRGVRLLLSGILLVNIVRVLAQAETGLAALQIGVGARPAGMGEAFVAVADDATSAFWNPAGHAWLAKRQAQLTHTEWFQEVQQNSVSFVFPYQRMAWGVHLLLNSVSAIEQRIYPTEEPIGTFSAHDFVFGLTLAKHIGERFAVGANVRYVNEKIYVENADGFSIDVGFQMRMPISGLCVGLVGQHLGATSELRREKIRLPHTVRFGGAYRLPTNWLHFTCLLAADYVYVFDEEAGIRLGMELQPLTVISLRVGYQTGWDTHDLSTGFGLHWNIFQLDYAYVPFKHDLGNVHRFTFIIDF